ncbi:MAG: hypothetical protein K0Q73_8183 [Paenibacillus sp.]|jgi:heterodisulfide reductase subunit C|nr:hypothetical protein [Paenibacillus sp.]
MIIVELFYVKQIIIKVTRNESELQLRLYKCWQRRKAMDCLHRCDLVFH